MAKNPRLSKKQREQIAQIRAKNYSASYEKRLIRGVINKKSRQEARGHQPGEASRRRTREKSENEGLTNDQIRSIRNWYSRFNPVDRKPVPDIEAVIDFAREEGYPKFVEYRKVWDAARRNYLRELAAGKWESRGLGFLEFLTDIAGVRDHGDIQWLYYH